MFIFHWLGDTGDIQYKAELSSSNILSEDLYDFFSPFLLYLPVAWRQSQPLNICDIFLHQNFPKYGKNSKCTLFYFIDKLPEGCIQIREITSTCLFVLQHARCTPVAQLKENSIMSIDKCIHIFNKNAAVSKKTWKHFSFRWHKPCLCIKATL